jgi:hypothetical protein
MKQQERKRKREMLVKYLNRSFLNVGSEKRKLLELKRSEIH